MAASTTRITGYPQVNKIRTFLQIAKDFTKPFDAIREAISNAMDASDVPPKNCTSYNVRKTKPVKRGDLDGKEDLILNILNKQFI